MTKLYAYLSYKDVEAAKAWLAAPGFELATQQADDEGRTVHAEPKRGDAVVMIAPPDAPYAPPASW